MTPYDGLDQTAFWRTSVTTMHRSLFDPMTTPRFALAKTDRISTIGSCFAQHLSRKLLQRGLAFLRTETRLSDADMRLLYFTANFGNVYTVEQALQLFRRSIGEFTPDATSWVDADGAHRDPLHPVVLGGTFSSVDAMLAARGQLDAAVRRMLEQQDVMVFTLGLTECWVRESDGAVLPSAPGVIGNAYDPAGYRFVNQTFQDTVAQLDDLLALVRGINPDCRVIFTVSPVPLAATAEQRHVAVSTFASKAILRAAVDEIHRRHDFTEYFPSFEIFFTPGIGGSYFDPDRRHVLPAGVNHAMRVFERHFLGDGTRVRSAAVDFGSYVDPYVDISCNDDLIDGAINLP